MRSLPLFLFGACAAASAAAAPSPAAEAAATQLVRTHVTFLADDLLEGRAAGTRGYDIAARYVAAEFQRLGLQPGATADSYLQPVRLLESKRDYAGARFTLRAAGQPDVSLEPLKDFVAAPVAGTESAEITGEAVFVGYGVHAPDHGYSDFAGVDLTGKIAVVLFNAPAKLAVTARAHFSHRDTKAAELARRGAIGMITVGSTWTAVLASAHLPAATLLAADGAPIDVVAGIRVGGSVSPAGAEKLFARSPRPLAEVNAAAQRSEPQAFPLGVTVTLAATAKERPFSSPNVLALLPGSDPALARDFIVVTSHLDHLGIGPAVNGDTIYNGAIDNAIGVGALLAAAEWFVRHNVKPRRPILFAAVTAEEKGLLGARHLSRNPPLGGRFAANLNVDAGPFFAPLRAAIGMGREHTTLGAVFETVATRLGWAIRPDPRPDERRFVRSDQYAFVKEGIPALRIVAAPESTDPKIDLLEIDRAYWRDRYHQRNDDLAHPIDFPSAGAFAVLLGEVTRAVADDPAAPAYLPGDFFGELFKR